MSPDETVMCMTFTVQGIKVTAEVMSLTPETVRLNIDPKAPWDVHALRCLSVALEMVAKILLLKRL